MKHNVLIIGGPPASGKTTLIRNLSSFLDPKQVKSILLFHDHLYSFEMNNPIRTMIERFIRTRDSFPSIIMIDEIIDPNLIFDHILPEVALTYPDQHFVQIICAFQSGSINSFNQFLNGRGYSGPKYFCDIRKAL